MRTRGNIALAAAAAGLAMVAGLLSTGSPAAVALQANSISAPDTAGIVGRYTSLELDASGDPVISHWDFGNRDLKIVHCNDANCSGGDESITAPDTAGDVGSYTSMQLDAGGYPVVSYYDPTNLNLKLMHCNDANCSGGDESITAPDAVGAPAQFTQLVTSLVLDGDGNPVVSYHDGIGADLNLMHCNDANCSGGDESITSPDTAGAVGYDSSLALDGAGNPVVSYRDATINKLKVLHCNDVSCAGGGESVAAVDSAGAVGAFTSIAIDVAGRPVISYFGDTNLDLKVLHCGNANCTSGNVITAVDTKGNVGAFTSLLLDGAGNPAVSYYDYDEGDLKVLRCGNPNCTSGNAMAVADVGTDGIDAGQFTSLELDSAGRPVVSYLDNWDSDLKVLHCSDAVCSGGTNSGAAPGTLGSVGTHSSLVLDSAGYPVVSYYDDGNDDLKVMHCNDPNCAGGGESITSPDVLFSVGQHTSIALDGAGNPVVGYYFENDGDLRILHCNDPNCAGGDESITTPDNVGLTGQRTSLALDASGSPVVSYYDLTNSDLKVLHCNDVDCAGGGESTTSPDTTGVVGLSTSLELDGSGFPVISYHDESNGDLKLLHCNDANCAGGGDSITAVDKAGNVGEDTSLALDSAGNPVVSYADMTNSDLRLFHCGDPNCNPDGDRDGCTDTQELRPPQEVASGGGRNPKSFWDFYDVPAGTFPSLTRDGSVSSLDLFAVLGRFGATGDSGIDPLSAPPAAPAYHTAYDRGAVVGPSVWNVGPADGSIASTDIFGVLGQFAHSCA